MRRATKLTTSAREWQPQNGKRKSKTSKEVDRRYRENRRFLLRRGKLETDFTRKQLFPLKSVLERPIYLRTQHHLDQLTYWQVLDFKPIIICFDIKISCRQLIFFYFKNHKYCSLYTVEIISIFLSLC